jgi:hypothetical protein
MFQGSGAGQERIWGGSKACSCGGTEGIIVTFAQGASALSEKVSCPQSER